MIAGKRTLPVSDFYFSQIDHGMWAAKTHILGVDGYGVELRAPGATLGEAEKNLVAWIWWVTMASGST